MNRLNKAVIVTFACGLAGLSSVAGAQQQVAQAALESTVITKGTTSSARAAPRRAAAPAQPAIAQAGMPLSDTPAPAEIGPPMSLAIGKSMLIRLPGPIERISVGNPAVADVTLISARELYMLGKTFGSTNVIMWRKGGVTTIIDVTVSMDAGALEQRLRQLLPEEKGITVYTAADAVVLSGVVSSSLKAAYAISVAEAFARSYARELVLPVTAGNLAVAPGSQLSVTRGNVGGGGGGGGSSGAAALRVINMMQIAQPQQVMLEVKVAEISKTLLDKLGVGIDSARVSGSWRYSILSNFLTESSGVLGMLSRTGNKINLDAEKQDGLIRVLAEPNIVALSGQEASFLAGGKIFLPVAQASSVVGGAGTVTLEEKDFGVGLKFTPTVLDGGRINLKVTPEVSELSQTGSAFTTINGTTSILPSFTTRRAQTTVQLMDGQSFAIAGLIKNNVTESVKRFPVLGEVPILGTLFRSSEFQTDRSELMFVITARLVKPLSADHALPTDNYIAPSRDEFFLNGQLEGSGHPDVPLTERQRQQRDQRSAAPAQSAAPPSTSDSASQSAAPSGQGGFQMK